MISGPLSTSSVCMRQYLKLFVGERLKICVYFCKCVEFRSVDNSPGSPGTSAGNERKGMQPRSF